jgi:hypothetical protein
MAADAKLFNAERRYQKFVKIQLLRGLVENRLGKK